MTTHPTLEDLASFEDLNTRPRKFLHGMSSRQQKDGAIQFLK